MTGPIPLPLIHPSGSCTGCGACCAQIGTPPFTYCEGDRPPAELAWDIDAHALRFDNMLPCLWYDPATRTCRHYEYRPAVCREFVVGSNACRSWRSVAALCEAPPPPNEEDGH